MGTKKTTTPPPEPYRPRVTVQGDRLPMRYKKSARTDRLVAEAARREVLRAVYFDQDGQN